MNSRWHWRCRICHRWDLLDSPGADSPQGIAANRRNLEREFGAPGGGGMLIQGAVCFVLNCAFLNNNITGGRGSALYVGRDGNGVNSRGHAENEQQVKDIRADNVAD